MARIDLPGDGGLEVGRALVLAPHFVDVVVGYERAVASSPLAPRLHELVRYRIALINQCTVCLDLRRDGSGVTDEDLAQVEDPGVGFTDTERAALRFTEMFCRDSAAIPDELLAELEAALGTAALVDLALVVGKYLSMGRFMQVLGLDEACSIDHARLAAL